MEVIYNGQFEYQPHRQARRNPSICHLEVLKDDSRAVVVATELASNPGMSITNSSEMLASEVRRKFNLGQQVTTFVEHYSDAISYGGQVHKLLHRSPDHYSIVTYTWDGNEARKPQWESITEEEFKQLIGGEE